MVEKGWNQRGLKGSLQGLGYLIYSDFLLRPGKKGRRKARKTDASDLTPNPQKLHNIGEQLQKLNAAIDGMGPVNDLPAVARARSRKEKNKLASRYETPLTALLRLLHRVSAPETSAVLICLARVGILRGFSVFVNHWQREKWKQRKKEPFRALWFWYLQTFSLVKIQICGGFR